MADYIDFVFICSYALPPGVSTPDWDNGAPYEGRATRTFIESIHGPLRDGETLQSAFDLDVAPSAKNAAETKFKKARGQIEMPVVIDAGDEPTIGG